MGFIRGKGTAHWRGVAGTPCAQVPLVPVHSEKELLGEMEAMAQPLAGTVAGWQQRISCMQRLQGIAVACSPHLQDVLLDHFMCVRACVCVGAAWVGWPQTIVGMAA